MSRRAPRPFSIAIEDLRGKLEPVGGLAGVQSAWREAAGEAIAAAARPVSLRDGTLTLECESSVWAQEIQMMGEELAARVQEAAPDAGVVKIRCVARAG